MQILIQKLKDLIKKMNEAGVPLPMIRVDGKPTLTGTLVFLSFNTALLGQLGRFSKLLQGVDLSQANYLFMISLGAYLGRRFQGDGKGGSIDAKEPDNK